MTKKLLVCLSALLMVSFSIKASDISGTYVGKLSVSVSLTGDDVPNTEIILSKDGDTYSLSVIDFSFMGISIGNLTVDGIARTDEGEGLVSLSKTDFSTGPKVKIIEDGPEVQTYILLTHAVIDNGEFELELDIKGDDKETDITEVTFLGNKQSSGLFNPKSHSLNIRISSDCNTISTIEKSGNYIIFSTIGASVQSGSIKNGAIDITSLNAGIYIVKTSSGIAKFVKK